MAVYFNSDARRRIRAAVRRVEQMRAIPQPRAAGQHPATQLPFLAIADEDIERGHSGQVKLASADSFDSEPTPSDILLLDKAYNPFHLKIWEGASLLLTRACLAGTAPDVDASAWVIVQAWSATRIRGKTQSGIAAGGTGVINVTQHIDGYYGLDIATVLLPTEFVSLEANRVVWAELTYGLGISEWVVYSADCDGGVA